MEWIEETSHLVGPRFIREGSTWRDVSLCRSAWRETQPPELNETVPAGRLGRDLVALGVAALLAGVGLELWLGSPKAARAPTAHADAAAPRAAPLRPPGPAPGTPR